MNDILERVEAEVKTEFAVGLVGVVDALAGDVDDAVAMWKVRQARSAAWTNAQVLWTLRPTALLRAAFFDKLDGLIGLASPRPAAPDGARSSEALRQTRSRGSAARCPGSRSLPGRRLS